MDAVAPGNSSFSQKITGILEKFPVILQLCRFVAIGFLNTGLAFIITNLVSKHFGIVQGGNFGVTSGVGFIFATAQSYYWNRNWAFGQQTFDLLKNFIRLVIVGLIGVLALALVVLGSKFTAPAYYYLILLVVFILSEYAIWHIFGLSASSGQAQSNPLVSFLIVSLVGFLINAGVAAKFSSAVHLTANADLNKNIALVVATAVSLIWNFIGYKLIVFKK